MLSTQSFLHNRKWRHSHPFAPFDRVAFNYCVTAAIASLEISLAAELTNYRSRFEAWEKAGSIESLRSKGKEGNVITRAFSKTGWWPLKKDSVLWEQAIQTLGPLCAPTKHKMSDKPHTFADFNDKRIKIRKLVLRSFQRDFIDRAALAEDQCKARV